MDRIRTFCCILGIVILSSCGSLPPVTPEVSELTAPASARSFTLPSMVTVETARPGWGILRDSLRLSLLPGRYTAVKENSLGTFYVGENYSLWEVRDSLPISPRNSVHRGGIWIPADPHAAPRVFYYLSQFRPIPDGAAPTVHTYQAANVSPANAADEVAVRQAGLSGASPLAAGLGGAVAGGMIEALTADARARLYFATGDLTDLEGGARIKAAAVAGHGGR